MPISNDDTTPIKRERLLKFCSLNCGHERLRVWISAITEKVQKMRCASEYIAEISDRPFQKIGEIPQMVYAPTACINPLFI